METATGRANIVFASTAYGPLWAPAVTTWLRVIGVTARRCEIADIGRITGAGITDRTYTMSAQNQIVEDFLAIPEATHLFMTEMDMLLPDDCILKLLELNTDMASGIYFLRGAVQPARGQPCLYKRAPGTEWKARLARRENSAYLHTPVSLFPLDKPFPVDCSGLGCVLIKRKVLEAMKKPWFDLKAATEEKLTGYGSDMFFYSHARALGFQLWVDPTVQCGQIDYYITDLEDYKWQLDNNPSFAGRGYIIGHGGNGVVSHSVEIEGSP